MNKKKKPKTWAEVYPMGTKEGNEEARFFRALARNPKYTWRSTAALAKEGRLTKERTEEIIAKYLKKGMIFQSPKNETLWGYWERVPEMLPDVETSLSTQDKKDRIDKASGCTFIPYGAAKRVKKRMHRKLGKLSAGNVSKITPFKTIPFHPSQIVIF